MVTNTQRISFRRKEVSKYIKIKNICKNINTFLSFIEDIEIF